MNLFFFLPYLVFLCVFCISFFHIFCFLIWRNDLCKAIGKFNRILCDSGSIPYFFLNHQEFRFISNIKFETKQKICFKSFHSNFVNICVYINDILKIFSVPILCTTPSFVETYFQWNCIWKTGISYILFDSHLNVIGNGSLKSRKAITFDLFDQV